MEINYFYLFRKYKFFFLLFVITAVVVTSISVYRQPALYEATAKIFINDGSNIKILYSMIKSDQIYDRVINQLNLVQVFKVENIGQTHNVLDRSLQAVLDSRVNTVEIKIRLKDGKLAAEIVNAFVLELQKIYPEIRLPETVEDPLDSKVVEKTIPPVVPIDQNKIEVIVLSVLLSVAAAVFLSILAEHFFSRGSKKEQ